MQEDGIMVSGFATCVVYGELTREGIRLGILRSGVIAEREVESSKKQCPPGLPRVETFGVLDVG
jgi:hypothetical protein